MCVCVCVCVQESQKIAEQKQEEMKALEREHKKARRQLQREGKKPFFLKKCESECGYLNPQLTCYSAYPIPLLGPLPLSLSLNSCTETP